MLYQHTCNTYVVKCHKLNSSLKQLDNNGKIQTCNKYNVAQNSETLPVEREIHI